MRWIACAAAAVLLAGAAMPAHALTQEEILKRRLEKMQQAEPSMRTEEQERDELNRRNASEVAVPAPKPDTAPLTMPDPVRHPPAAPEPKGGLWQQPATGQAKQAAAPQPAPVAAPAPQPPAARNADAGAASPPQGIPINVPAPSKGTPINATPASGGTPINAPAASQST
ncbi:MAG: hypothetical protein VB033_05560, partial [Solidesulfovibrio sp.]|nr:hypothetical protein [Solidesulfovibrio sp.]